MNTLVDCGKIFAKQSEYLAPVTAFYGYEAMLLDENRFNEWLELLAEDIVYQIPVRTVTKDGAGEYDSGALRVNDDLIVIQTRVKRLRTGWGWAEEPPSRVVRCVGSVMVEEMEEGGKLRAKSAVLLHRQRGQNEAPDVIAYRRVDELIAEGGNILIRRRTIFMMDNVLRAPNISIFM